MIKTDNESPGEIHPLALAQLAAKQLIAGSWQTFRDDFPDDKSVYQRCSICDLAIYQLVKNGLTYAYSEDEKQAMLVAHISNHHPEAFNGID